MDPDIVASYREPSTNTDRRKKLLLIAIVVVAGVVAAFLVPYLTSHTGQLIITTNNSSQNTISIEPSVADGGQEGATLQQLESGKAASLHAGTYLVTVEGPVNSVARTVEVKAHRTSRYTMDLSSGITSAELVGNVNAISFNVSPSALYYLDKSTNLLYQIDANNQVSQLSAVSFNSIHWADQTYGIGRDANNALYVIDNGSVSKIQNVPASFDDKADVSVAPDHTIYLAIGAAIYSGTPSSGFSNIYTSPNQPVSVFAASQHQVAVAYTAGDASRKQPVFTVLTDGKKTAESAIDGYEFAWSPDGKHIAVTADTNSQIFDTSLQRVATIPRSNVNNLTWFGNSKLLYSVQDKLFEYALSSSNISRSVAATQTNHDISNIVVGPGQTYIYLAAQNLPLNNDTFSLSRYGVNTQKVTDYLDQIQAGLPAAEGGCSYGIVNFLGKPVFQYSSSPGNDCLSAAQAFVQQYNLDTGKFTFQQIDSPLSGLSSVQSGTAPEGQN
ncbi:MAG TPA: hypothetical protein VJP80_07600 [Candidatus Saccharimonadales bacterium]|nr:hypothetical protein [Candidatus Saccharimonadales bacterium]